ncbi:MULTISPECIES: tRNA-uridine aminocarboxypropyltransferase [Massilia]|uniref:tRNA-uridine aminocarboxypropyltransferase n=1 Tax=Massilia aurea TaxID=373040 RepID=A0A422QI07_9BURK|nr:MULTISPECIES: tRNA-uridine aminocarboxypropyltransferase [Massilia]MDY0963744.1 tRNA-uridine aminocarboxypropyltransferase [Massilia sp. CFBP9026]RNF29602.1 DTW domain containing protein [Massilia aurea]
MKRPTCPTCLRAQSTCICHWIAHVEPEARLLVLLHPLETGNAKNSGRLLHLSVAGSELIVGETFDADVLDNLLHADGRTPVLLYPQTPDDRSVPPPPALPSLPASMLRLVVLDATWRKSRKMLYLNPGLQKLPRLALSDVAPSNYRIRKAHAPHQLSSLEAAAQALGQLECDGGRYGALLEAFDGFVSQQASYVRA